MNKLKCGVITFHRAHNYGAILQTYALQKTLEKYSIDCEVIDYRSRFIENYYKPISFSNIPSLKKIAAILLFNGKTVDNNKVFNDFTRNYLKTSEELYYDHKDLEVANDKYDFFVAGSDQIWNYITAGFIDSNYFLNFVNDSSKKNAYAPSFGVDNLPENKKNAYINLLKDFNNLSVRESKGSEIVNDLLNYKPTVVLDPTILLDKKSWSKIASKSNEKEEYLLLYLIAESNEIIELAKKIAKEKKIKIIYLNNRLFKLKGVDNRKKTEVNEWLSLFLNANCIVTNSFHGLAFSVNFEKEFFIQYLPKPAKVNSRLVNLLSLLQLNDRVVKNNTDLQKIDYEKVNTLLEKERRKSLLFIEKMISSY